MSAPIPIERTRGITMSVAPMRTISLAKRFEPKYEGVVDVDIAIWDRLPKRGERCTFGPADQPLDVVVKYRRRYPALGIARIWVRSA